MQFQEWLDRNWQKDNMFPPALEAQTALNFLQIYLLINNNPEIVLTKNSIKFIFII